MSVNPLKRRLGLIVLAAVAAALWPPLATALLIGAAGFALGAVFVDSRRLALLQGAATLAWGCLLALAWYLASDRFDLRYVWLYSSADLPLPYKLANVWGGDEGTTLMLAAFCATLAARDLRKVGDVRDVRSAATAGVAGAVAARRAAPVVLPIAGRVAALIAAWYAITAAVLMPFAGTPPEWLADQASQGMNAHLVKIWMLLHAPLVLVAYAWILLLVVPSIAALVGALPSWPMAARRQARQGWVVLSAGIGFGMIWAFEDPMYGQIWHWDPVQTAVFAVWCFLSAHLHALVSWRAGAAAWRWAPMTAMLAAVGAALAMAVTRNPVLASSHRYVGAQSWISHAALAVVLLAVLVVLMLRSRHPAAGAAPRTSASGWGLRLAQWAFAAAGVLALIFLAQAFIAAGLGLPRGPEDKPFMAMLLNLVHGDDRKVLKAAFERWDVQGYALARSLLVPLALFGLAGGWYFLRRVSSRLAWWALAAALLAVAATWSLGGVMTRLHAGRGILSQRIVAVLPWLDAILVAGAFLALACAVWVVVTLGRQGWQALSAVLPSATVHVGVALMLWGGLLSTALNSQIEYQVPMSRGGDWQQDSHGNALRLPEFKAGPAADGGYAAARAVHAVTSIEFRDAAGALFTGEARYRDDRPPPDRYDGPLRAACEMFDYRYARFVSTPGYILEPAISHAWSGAMQVWVSPAAALTGAADVGSGGAVTPAMSAPAAPSTPSTPPTPPGASATEKPYAPYAPADPDPALQGPVATVLVKIFPYASLLWLGLILAVLGGGWLAFAPSRGGR